MFSQTITHTESEVRQNVKKTVLRALVGLVVVVVLCAPAMAREVSVPLVVEEGGSLKDAKEKAMKTAFLTAVMEEAESMLPGQLPAERKDALNGHLSKRLGRLVPRFAELRREMAPEGETMVLDVTVNRNALGHELKRVGMYTTLSEPMDFQLQFANATPDDLAEVVRLKSLFGLRDSSDAMVVMSVGKDGAMWLGSLSDGGEVVEKRGSTLNTIWTELWGQYFSSQEGAVISGDSTLESAGGFRLVMNGFPSTDAVYAFDKEMSSWAEAVDKAVFQTITMRGTGLGAVWRVRVRNPEAFRSRLDAYSTAKGLTAEVSE